jgi:fibronectin type 3 domain-containing protein
MKKVGGFCVVLIAVFLASMLFTTCANGLMRGILGDNDDGGGGNGGTSVDTSYPVLSRNMFMGGSLLYVADSPASGHLVPGASVGVRLGKVNYNPAAAAEGSAEPGPLYAENTDSTRYGYITVETVDSSSIRFQYTEYTADGKSSVVKGSHSLELGEEKDINGDSIPDISYTLPDFTRAGFEQALTLNFLSSTELVKLNTTMFTVLPEQNANKEYPSGIIGINPYGDFIVSKYTSTGARSLVRGIESGDLIIDGINYKYQRAKSSGGSYRSARSVDDNDTEDLVDSPDLYFPLMSVDFSYEIEDVGPAMSQSRSVIASTLSDFQEEQEGIRKTFKDKYKYVVYEKSVDKGYVTGALKLGVNGEKINRGGFDDGGTIALQTGVVVLVDANLKEKLVSVDKKISLLGGGFDFLKDKNLHVPIVVVYGVPVFWIDITPSLVFDYLLEVTVDVDMPLKGGFTGMYGADMTVWADYTPEMKSMTPNTSGEPIKNTAAYFGLNDNPAAASLTVSVGPYIKAAVEVRPGLGIDIGVAKASAGVYGTISFEAEEPIILAFMVTEHGLFSTLSIKRNFAVNTTAGVDIRASVIGIEVVNWGLELEPYEIWNQTETVLDPVPLIVPMPAVPKNVTATAQSSNSVQITWGSVVSATSYKVYRSTSSDASGTLVGTPIDTSYTDTTASPATTYYYRVSAFNSSGESAQSSAPSVTTVPAAPQNVTAIAQFSNSVQITWGSVSGATSYKVYRATSTGASGSLVGTSTGISYTDTTVSSTTTYYYRVSAINGSGEGTQSSASTVTTPPALVATPTASVVAGAVISGTTITLSTTTAGATIYYTTNGAAPTTASTQYATPITVTTPLTIKAIAVKSGFIDSSVLTTAYTISTGTGSVVIQYWTDATAALATNTGQATLSRSAGATATINAAGSGYSDHQWSLNNADAGTAASYTFDSALKSNGTYYIALVVKKENIWYSTTITITVTD